MVLREVGALDNEVGQIGGRLFVELALENLLGVLCSHRRCKRKRETIGARRERVQAAERSTTHLEVVLFQNFEHLNELAGIWLDRFEVCRIARRHGSSNSIFLAESQTERSSQEDGDKSQVRSGNRISDDEECCCLLGCALCEALRSASLANACKTSD